MELLQLLEFAAKSGFLALVLALGAVGYLVREIRRMRAEHRKDEDDCAKRVSRLQRAVFDMHLWARSHGGGRRRAKLPDLSELIGPRDDDDDASAAPPTQH